MSQNFYYTLIDTTTSHVVVSLIFNAKSFKINKKRATKMTSLNRKEWHETFLKMVASASMITFIIYMSCLIIYILLSQISQYFIVQNIVSSFSFISLFILTMQTLRSMYHVYYLPLMNSCAHTYQKLIFFCSSFSIALIVLSSFFFNFTQMLKTYYN